MSPFFSQSAHLLLMFVPLLVALLFLVFIVYWSHRAYTTVYRRTSPPSTYEERKEYRMYFRAALLGGTVLLAGAMYWWTQAQLPKQYVFQGTVIGLERTQQLVPQERGFYARAAYRAVGANRQVVDYQFAIVQDAPFYRGQTFKLGLYPESGVLGKAKPELQELTLTYRGMNQDQLTLRREDGGYVLVPVTEVK